MSAEVPAEVIASDLAVAIASSCAVETGFDRSAVLSTEARPIVAFVTAAIASDLAVATFAVVARSEVSAIP